MHLKKTHWVIYIKNCVLIQPECCHRDVGILCQASHCTLSNAFSASIDMIMWFLSLLLFMWCITFIDLQILYHPCIPGMNPTWSWCMVFLMYCWMQFANILLRILASMFISDIGLKFSFFVVSLSGFGIRMMLPS